MNTAQQLTQVFMDNFVTYYRSHVAHVNILGRNFYSDHALLGGIYESLQAETDRIAELLRTLGEFMPCCITDILEASHIEDLPLTGTSDELLEAVRLDLEHLRDCYQELIVIAAEDMNEPIGNYAQDRVLALNKQIWQLDSTLS